MVPVVTRLESHLDVQTTHLKEARWVARYRLFVAYCLIGVDKMPYLAHRDQRLEQQQNQYDYLKHRNHSFLIYCSIKRCRYKVGATGLEPVT